MGENRNWWTDPAFWDTFGPLMFDAGRIREAAADVDGIVGLTGAVPPARILDAGCGPGRHSLELARRGFQVTGIDLQKSYLEQAMRNASGGQIRPEPLFIHGDVRNFTADRPFQGAISLFQSLGYTGESGDDLETCRRIHSVLDADGWLIVEMDGKEALAARFEERTWFERDGHLVLLECEAAAAWTRLEQRWILRRPDGTWTEYELSYRLYSAEELGRLLLAAGFRSVEFFGSLDGRPYNQYAERLVALALRS